MALVDELNGLRVCIDTAPIIYFIEKDNTYISIIRSLFGEIASGNIESITSTITLLEVLVHPFRNNNQTLIREYRDILLYSENLTAYEISHEVSELSAKLRAKYFIKTPDAIQIAVGILYGADVFLTNDTDLKKVSEIKVLVIDDFIK
ncbi:PIN domain-containing protein [bacterium]|nr:PIN domain-containing protein [bacterium]MBU1599502.1 PIN domain-containing protein [bacterium]MBU2462179.1 PIN domain-containing protein [bacterium]